MNEENECNELMYYDDISINGLLALPDVCVYALINEVDRRCQVFSTTSLNSHLGSLMKDIKVSGEWSVMKDDISKLRLCILETLTDKRELKIRQSYWIESFNKKEYKNYKDLSPVSYKVDIELAYRHGKLCYFVYLKNTRKDRILVGLFRLKASMDEFLNQSYPNGVIQKIIRHSSVDDLSI